MCLDKGRGNEKAKCPNCGKTLSGWSALEKGTSPKEGDFSLCVYCSSFLVFNTDLTLRLAEEDEVYELADHLLNLGKPSN